MTPNEPSVLGTNKIKGEGLKGNFFLAPICLRDRFDSYDNFILVKTVTKIKVCTDDKLGWPRGVVKSGDKLRYEDRQHNLRQLHKQPDI